MLVDRSTLEFVWVGSMMGVDIDVFLLLICFMVFGCIVSCYVFFVLAFLCFRVPGLLYICLFIVKKVITDHNGLVSGYQEFIFSSYLS